MKEDKDIYVVVVECIHLMVLIHTLHGANTYTLMKHKLLGHTHE